MSDKQPQRNSYPLRMPDELRVRLEAAAKSSGRSLHSEIVARLEASLAGEETAEQRQSRREEMRRVANEEIQAMIAQGLLQGPK